MIVTFKSVPDNWEKECDGRKPNTFRRFVDGDERFEVEAGDTIVIVNTENGEAFERTLTDVTFWDGYAILSWKHEEAGR